MQNNKPVTRIALFGAAPDTPNMGVSALFMSAVTGISQHINPVEFLVFDNGLGCRNSILKTPDGTEIQMFHYGARGGRRYYRPENLMTMLLASRLGRIGAYLNAGIHLIDSCDAVLDVSGGDSFSDIYGRERFDNIYRPKAIAINRGKPLILLPQTYGPYKAPVVRQLAASVVRKASMAWARDAQSYQALKALLGNDYAPERHLCGVDMAFDLQPSNAKLKLDAALKSWLESKDESQPLVGFNVSGLIYNDPAVASVKYGLKADYRQAVVGFLGRLLQETPARIVLISHVMDQPGHYESDLAACLDVAAQLDKTQSGRVAVAPATLDQSQAKWLISKMDWFCGTRMHSTIAALSSGIPTASISYSDKALGVFETCGQGDQVIDPRRLDSDQIIERLIQSFAARGNSRDSLEQRLPQVIALAKQQIQFVAENIFNITPHD